MTGKINQISSWQLVSFIISSQIGLGILTLPSILAKKVGHDGWIPVLLSGMAVLFLVIPIIGLLKRFPGKSILDINVLVYGKIIGMLLNLLLVAYLIFSTGISTRIFVELINIIVLKETPKIVISLLIISPTFYFTVKGLKVVCRFANLLYLAHVLMLLTFLLILRNVRFTYLLPVAKPGFLELIKAMPCTAYSFLGFELAAIFYPNVINKEHTMKHIIIGIIYTAIFFTLITVVPVLLFGEDKLKLLVFPIFNIEQAIRVPVIERLDLFFIIFWFATMAASVRTYFFSSFYCVLKLFNIQRKKLLIFSIILITLIVGRIPPNFESLYAYMDYCAILGMANVGVILISLLISLAKKEACSV